MKVLMISTDKNILEEGSVVRERMVSYGTICDELYILVVGKLKVESRKSVNSHEDNKGIKIGENIFVYTANASFKLSSLYKAYSVGTSVLSKSHKLEAESWLITAQDPFETGFIAWCISKKTKSKLQLQIHTDFLSPYFSRESFLNKIRIIIAKFLLPKADGVRVVSERITSSLKANNYKLKAVPFVLPIFVDIEKIRKAIPTVDLHKKYPQFDFIFLMASRLTREKNIEMAIDAMKEVSKKYLKVGLIIVGSGSEEQKLKLKVKNHELGVSVIFEPWQSDLTSYYKTADAFLLTSKYEGFGMTLVEAIASDCPVISSDVGIVGNILIKNEDVLVCSSEDINCFVGNMGRFIEHKDVRKEFTMRAQTALGVFRGKDDYLNRMKESWEVCFG
ncbi:MAG: capsular polysaccharide biosynthsis protein [Parcubacteria group bacterium LiPW_30]|nr:MAG: capsular polysaccharide biosynthsis protein [Parcubacteria group bacterium LiPW_30]